MTSPFFRITALSPKTVKNDSSRPVLFSASSLPMGAFSCTLVGVPQRWQAQHGLCLLSSSPGG